MKARGRRPIDYFRLFYNDTPVGGARSAIVSRPPQAARCRRRACRSGSRRPSRRPRSEGGRAKHFVEVADTPRLAHDPRMQMKHQRAGRVLGRAEYGVLRVPAGKSADTAGYPLLCGTHCWQCHASVATALARREGVSRSYFTRLIRLSYLAPDITQAILDAGQPRCTRTGRCPATSPRQRAPRVVGMPRSLSAISIPVALAIPSARMALMTGNRGPSGSSAPAARLRIPRRRRKSQVGNGLFAGGKWIQTIGPAVEGIPPAMAAFCERVWRGVIELWCGASSRNRRLCRRRSDPVQWCGIWLGRPM